MLSQNCMANNRVEAVMSKPYISKLLRTLHTTSDLTSDNHTSIVTRSRYVRARAGFPAIVAPLFESIVGIQSDFSNNTPIYVMNI